MRSFRRLLLQRLIQCITVVRFVADQVLGLRFEHVEVEAQLHQGHFVMVRGMGADRQRQAVAIHDGQDLDALAAARRADFGGAEPRLSSMAPRSRSSLARSAKNGLGVSLRYIVCSGATAELAVGQVRPGATVTLFVTTCRRA